MLVIKLLAVLFIADVGAHTVQWGRRDYLSHGEERGHAPGVMHQALDLPGDRGRPAAPLQAGDSDGGRKRGGRHDQGLGRAAGIDVPGRDRGRTFDGSTGPPWQPGGNDRDGAYGEGRVPGRQHGNGTDVTAQGQGDRGDRGKPGDCSGGDTTGGEGVAQTVQTATATVTVSAVREKTTTLTVEAPASTSTSSALATENASPPPANLTTSANLTSTSSTSIITTTLTTTAAPIPVATSSNSVSTADASVITITNVGGTPTSIVATIAPSPAGTSTSTPPQAESQALGSTDSITPPAASVPLTVDPASLSSTIVFSLGPESSATPALGQQAVITITALGVGGSNVVPTSIVATVAR